MSSTTQDAPVPARVAAAWAAWEASTNSVLGQRVTHPHYPGCVGVLKGVEQADDKSLLGLVRWMRRGDGWVTPRERATMAVYFPLGELEVVAGECLVAWEEE